MGRIRQIIEIAADRAHAEWVRDMTAREAEVRLICSYVAAAAGWKEGANSAPRIRLFHRDAEETPVDDLPSVEQVQRMFGGMK